MTGLTTGAITAMIDRLEKRDYVRREFDKDDRRKVLVVPDVKKINEEIGKYTLSMGKAFSEQSDQLSMKELEIIYNFLVRSDEVATEEISKLKKSK